MKKIRWVAIALILLLSAGLLVGCDEAMLEEMLEAEGFDEAHWEELEAEMEALEAYMEQALATLSPEERQAFEDRLTEKMDARFGDMEAEMDERMAAVEARIEQQLAAGEITEEEAFGLMMQTVAEMFLEMLQIMEDLVPYLQEALQELFQEFDIDAPPFVGIQPGETLILMTIDNTLARVNYQEYRLDQAPIVRDGRTLVPLRFVGEAMGAAVSWNPDDWTVTYSTPDTQILLTIDDRLAYVNGEPVEIDVAPTIVNGRTLVPVRFVSEAMGFQVDWISATRQVVISGSP